MNNPYISDTDLEVQVKILEILSGNILEFSVTSIGGVTAVIHTVFSHSAVLTGV